MDRAATVAGSVFRNSLCLASGREEILRRDIVESGSAVLDQVVAIAHASGGRAVDRDVSNRGPILLFRHLAKVADEIVLDAGHRPDVTARATD